VGGSSQHTSVGHLAGEVGVVNAVNVGISGEEECRLNRLVIPKKGRNVS
jgi:hypothetical protein